MSVKKTISGIMTICLLMATVVMLGCCRAEAYAQATASAAQASPAAAPPEGTAPARSKTLPAAKTLNSQSAAAPIRVLNHEHHDHDKIELVLEEPEMESLGVFIVTAYCPCEKCCGIWRAQHPSRIGTDFVQKTKSGTIPTEGRTIGVDPDVIPLGSVVVIGGHPFIAEDTGALVKGNVVDIFFKSHEEACEWGAKYLEIFVPAAG